MSYTYEQAIKALNDRTRGLMLYTEDDYDIMEDIVLMNTNINNIQEEEENIKHQQKALKQKKKDLKAQEREEKKDLKEQEREQKKDLKEQEREEKKENKAQERETKKKNKELANELLIDRECAIEYVKIYCKNIKIINKKPLIAYMWDIKSKLWVDVDEYQISNPIYNVLVEFYKKLLGGDNLVFLLVKEGLGCDDKLRKIKNQVYQIIDKDDKFDILKLNKSAYELPIKDGRIINLKTLEIRERNINDYFSFELSVEFLGDNYNKEVVNKFMSEIYKKYSNGIGSELITDDELIEYHKRFFGYCLSGDIGDRSLHINTGVGCNGKSSIINIMKAITGKNTCQLSPNVLIKKSSSTLTPELEVLKDARLALMPESEKGDEINCGFIKTFTGGDEIDCRPLYRKNITFITQAKGVLNTQFVPKIPNDKAMWDRIKIIKYLAVFDNTMENTEYIKKLQTEHLNDFFTYFCFGGKEYFKSGFNKCQSMEETLKEVKENSNVFLSFINETYDSKLLSEYYSLTNEDKSIWRIPRTQVYENFTSWCDDDNNKEYKNITRNDFYKEMRKYIGEIKISIEFFTCKYKGNKSIDLLNTAKIL